MKSVIFDRADLRTDFGPADVRALREALAPILDDLLGKERWVMDESDYGFGLGVMFEGRNGETCAFHAAYVNRREGEGAEGSYIVTPQQARAIIEVNL